MYYVVYGLIISIGLVLLCAAIALTVAMINDRLKLQELKIKTLDIVVVIGMYILSTWLFYASYVLIMWRINAIP